MATRSVDMSLYKAETRVRLEMKRNRILLYSILVLCAAGVLLASLFYSGTWFGFALAFGGGIVAMECVLVIRRIRARLRVSVERRVLV